MSHRKKSGQESDVPHDADDTGEAEIVKKLAELRRFPKLKDIERFAVAEALKRANGNQSVAARLLGMTRQALNKRLNRSKTSSDDA